jgi:hypothetical protein
MPATRIIVANQFEDRLCDRIFLPPGVVRRSDYCGDRSRARSEAMCSSLFSPMYKGVAAVQGRAIDNPHAALLSRVACRFLLVKPSQSGQI